MDQPALPLNYYCRSARLCLKKADFARKAGQHSDELLHLKKFENLLLSTIPRHPNYHLNRGESQIADLQIILVDVEKRIRTLETELHGRGSSLFPNRTTSKPKPPRSSSLKTTRKLSSVDPSPRKTRKSVRKSTTKKREKWEDWSTRLSQTPPRKRISSSPHLLTKSPTRRKSRSPRSPRRTTAGSKYWESSVSHRTCANCGHDHEPEDTPRWMYSDADRAGTDRLRDLSRKLLYRESSRSPISRALAPLEDDFINLQALVIELKGSFEGFKLRFDEEGRLWRSRTEGLEKDLQYIRHDMEVDMLAIKRSIRDEVKKGLDGLTNDLSAAEDLWALSEVQKKEKLQNVREESSAMMEDFKDRMNFSFVETKALLLKNVDEKIANSMVGIKSSLRSDFEILELGIARDVEDMKREMMSKCESFLPEVELAGIGGKQRVESLIKEGLEKFLPQKLDNLVGKERTLTEMKEAVCLLWKEVEALSKSKKSVEDLKRGIESEEAGKGYIRQAMDSCFPIKDTAMDRCFPVKDTAKERSINEVKEELRTLWTEVDLIGQRKKDEVNDDGEQIKKQLHYVRKEAMQARVEIDDVKKDIVGLKRNLGDLEFKLLHVQGLPQLLNNIEEAKSKVDGALSFIEKEKNLAITAASDAASAASKAGQMVEDVIGSVRSEKIAARRKSCEFQESLAMEKDMVAESASVVLSEVKRKSLHLQESLEQDICKVKESFATEVRRMSMDLNQEKDYATSEVREFQKSLKDAFAALEKERDAASCAASEITALAEKAEGLVSKFKDGGAVVAVLQTETDLDWRGKDESLVRNLMILESRIKQASSEQSTLKEKMNDTNKRVRKLENVQANFVLTVNELKGLEKSAAVLIPKFETAGVVLKELERRVGLLEAPPGTTTGTPGVGKRKRVKSPVPGGKSFDSKFLMLENRIDHVASATYTNLRILDTKVEKLSSGVQTALDGTTAIDNKCSALGEEVVRVFRMFLTARKQQPQQPQPEKKAITPIASRKRQQRWDTSGPLTPANRCICCNTGNRWTQPSDTMVHRNPKCPQHPDYKNREVRKINVRLGPEICAVRSESPLHCTIHTSPTKQLRSDSPVHCTITTTGSPTKQNQVSLLDILDNEVAKLAEEEENIPDDNGIREDGAANFRLESGRIHVNVRHA